MGKIYPDNDVAEVEKDFCTALLLKSACYVELYMYTYAYTYIHKYICLHAYTHIFIRTSIRTRMHLQNTYTKSFQCHITYTSNILNFVSLEFMISKSSN